MADFIEDHPPPPPPLSWYFGLTKAELEGVGDLEPSSFEWLLLLTAESHLLSPPLQCLTAKVTPHHNILSNEKKVHNRISFCPNSQAITV